MMRYNNFNIFLTCVKKCQKDAKIPLSYFPVTRKLEKLKESEIGCQQVRLGSYRFLKGMGILE